MRKFEVIEEFPMWAEAGKVGSVWKEWVNTGDIGFVTTCGQVFLPIESTKNSRFFREILPEQVLNIEIPVNRLNLENRRLLDGIGTDEINLPIVIGDQEIRVNGRVVTKESGRG